MLTPLPKGELNIWHKGLHQIQILELELELALVLELALELELANLIQVDSKVNV